MRTSLRNLLGDQQPSHLGLAYEVWSPAEDDPARAAWLAAIEAGSRSAAQTPVYAQAFARWSSSLAALDARTVALTAESRLLVGHGNPSAFDVGLTIHRTWGVPYIPGSAVKGLTQHYVDVEYGPTDRRNPARDPVHAEPLRAPFGGPRWSKDRRRVEHGPGEQHRTLFGSSDADDLADDDGHDGSRRGEVTFHDMLLIPTADPRHGAARPSDRPLLVRDVLTVHQRGYYRSGGATTPNDYDSPIPVPFLTVAPGWRFLLAVSGPRPWANLAANLTLEAIQAWGIGGKTSSGYGRMNEVESTRQGEGWQASERWVPPLAPELAALDAFLKEKREARDTEPLTRRQCFERLAGPDWAHRLGQLPTEGRKDALRRIDRALGKGKEPELFRKIEQALDLP